MSLQFRPAKESDVDDVIPLMFSAGPDAYRYVFSIDSKDQVLDFLRYAYCKGDGEFGYRDHLVATDNGTVIGLVGHWHGSKNLSYMLAAVRQIVGYYGFFKALRVIARGLRFEKIVSPPAKKVLVLHNLAVSDSRRGAGYGKQIIEHFLQRAAIEGISSVGLDVAETNPRAKNLYLRIGFNVKQHSEGNLVNQYGRGVSHEYMEISI